MTAKKIRSQPFDHSIVFGAESANKSGVFISKAALKQIKKEETSLLFGEVSSGLKTYRCFSLIWQITLIWIPMHLLCFPGCILAQGGVHFSASGVQITVGRGALWRRRGAFSEGGVHQAISFSARSITSAFEEALAIINEKQLKICSFECIINYDLVKNYRTQ